MYGRRLRSLRVSVVDRCNLRCRYCMPEAEYTWLSKADILSFEEISRLIDVFVDLGVGKVRLTGGEPLLRRGLPELVRQIAAKPQIRDITLTTNGVLLADALGELRAAGLHRVTVSLDTLDPERFSAISQRQTHPEVLAGIAALAESGMRDTKLDTVIVRGVNDDELPALIEFARDMRAEVRFIEYMDVGGATEWNPDLVVSRREMVQRIADHFGAPTPLTASDAAPAARYALPDGTTFGIISSTTQPFCSDCDRSRLTADGMWFRCLYARQGVDLRAPLRAGADRDALRTQVRSLWAARTDRGAEQRLALSERRALLPVSVLRSDPHLEMHTRGG